MKTNRYGVIGWLIAVLFMLGGPLIGIVVFGLAIHVEQQRLALLCTEYVTLQKEALERELRSIGEELYRLRSFFNTSDRVSRDQFRGFAMVVIGRHAEVRALEWLPRVTAGQRKRHEKSGRAEGLRDYRIFEKGPNGVSVAAAARETYYPVFYAEPEAQNHAALGFDVSSEENRDAAVHRAVSTRTLALTEPISLVQSEGEAKGFLALLPVYATAVGDTETGTGEPKGLLLAVFTAADLLRTVVVSDNAGRASRMRFQLVETEVVGEQQVIASSPDWDTKSPSEFRIVSGPIDLGGQRWRLIGQPTEELLSAELTRAPLLLGLGAFLFWEMLGGLTFALTKRSHDSALQEQGRMYQAVFSSLSEGVALAGVDGKLRLFNPAAEKMLGMGVRPVKVPEWTGTYGIFYPDGTTPFPPEQLPLARAVNGETVRDVELLIRNPSLPQGVWINVSGAPVKDDSGKLQGGVVIFHDISEKKRMAAELQASVKELEDLKYAVDQATIIAVTDRHGTIQSVNDKFCEISGYSREELLGQTHRLVNSGYHPREFFVNMWMNITAGKVWRAEIRNRTKCGQYYWVDTTIVPLLGDDGTPERYLAIRSDITVRKRQDENLLRLYSAVEQTADSVFVTNPEGVIEYVNPAFEATTGYSRNEALGQTPRILKSGKQTREHYELLWKTILAGETYQSIVINRKKSGEHYHAEQSITPIRDSRGNIINFVSVVKDITERMKLQENQVEMHFASVVQRRLYPACSPEIDGLDIAGSSYPAVSIGGDYYDFIPMHGGQLGIVVGDVSGHGLGPAIIMSQTRAHLRCLAQLGSDLGTIMNSANQALCADLDSNRYVALLFCGIDVSSRRLSYANAGHIPGYLLDRNGDLKLVLDATGCPLGILESASQGCNLSIPIEPGDMVVLVTDGITEAEEPSGDFFGAERALEIVRGRRHEPAQQIVQHLYQASRKFDKNHAQTDDVTAVVIKVGPIA